MYAEISRVAAVLARELLIVMGATAILVCALRFASGATASIWIWLLAVLIAYLDRQQRQHNEGFLWGFVKLDELTELNVAIDKGAKRGASFASD